VPKINPWTVHHLDLLPYLPEKEKKAARTAASVYVACSVHTLRDLNFKIIVYILCPS